jgi:hypothetical protein
MKSRPVMPEQAAASVGFVVIAGALLALFVWTLLEGRYGTRREHRGHKGAIQIVK